MKEEKEEQGMRLNKYLSNAGVCSRRQADLYIEEGKVYIDDHIALMGERVFPGQQVICCGEKVECLKEDKVLLAFYKPKGIVCTTSSKEKNNIVDYIGYEKRIYPIGRLDKDSEGLILLTNEGELSDQILRGSNYHEKEYIVTLNREITEEDLEKLREGIPILDTVTRPCKVYRLRSNVFRIILTQGLNRQIRRMCEYLGYRVVYLKRIRIMNILLDGISKGKYRKVTAEEWQELKRMLHDKNQETLIAKIVHKRREEAYKTGKTPYQPVDYNKKKGRKQNGYQKDNTPKRTDQTFK